MTHLQDIETIKYHLKNKEVVFIIQKGTATYFALHQKKIRVYNECTHYYLPIEEFFTLFEKETFYLYEKKEEELISIEKDEEYYSWHKK